MQTLGCEMPIMNKAELTNPARQNSFHCALTASESRQDFDLDAALIIARLDMPVAVVIRFSFRARGRGMRSTRKESAPMQDRD